MGRRFSPLADRMKAYEATRRLVEAERVARVSEIVRDLDASGIAFPSRMTIRRWVLGKTSPFSGKRLYSPRPSEELSFFLGAWLGDGWGDQNDGGKRMRLKVRSGSFAAEFAHAATSVLSKSEPYGVWTTADGGKPWYNVKATSFMLYAFVNQDLENLKSTIVANPRGFLRGFATAEGCPVVSISKRRGPRLDVSVAMSNCDLTLLEFSRELLVRLGFRPGKVRLTDKAGTKTNIAVATKDAWLLTISGVNDVRRFTDIVGFADSEKQRKLIDAIETVREFGAVEGGKRWLELYKKVRGSWVKKS